MTAKLTIITRVLLLLLIQFLFLTPELNVHSPPTTVSLYTPSGDKSPAQIYLPNSPTPTIDFDVIDLRSLHLSFEEKVVISSIEGVVNRDFPNVYFLYSEIGQTWLDYVNTSTNYRWTKIPVQNISAIITRYASSFEGIILLNASNHDELNLASPLAGAYNSLLISHSIYESLASSILQNYLITKNITAELEDMPTRYQRYAYAIDHYFPLCNQSGFAMYTGNAPLNMRGFIIANSLFTFWRILYVYTEVPLETGNPALNPDPEEELLLFESFLNNTPGNIPIFGYGYPDGSNEGEFIRRISENNKYLIAADYFENLPFHSSLKLPEGYEFSQYRPEHYPTLENKIYITGIWSDGDNIQYVYNFMRSQLWQGKQAMLSSVPTGWTINPSLYNLAPYILKYYYENATLDDYFIGGLSGKGYCKMDYFSNSTIREDFLKDSQKLWSLTDQTEARIWKLDRSAAEVTATVRLNGIFDGYGGGRDYKDPRVVNGIPIIKSIGVSYNTEDVRLFVEKLAKTNPIRPKFLFLHLHCWSITSEMWVNLATKLQDLEGVEVIRSDYMSDLMNQWDGIGNRYVVYGLSSILLLGLLGVGFLVFHKIRENRKDC